MIRSASNDAFAFQYIFVAGGTGSVAATPTSVERLKYAIEGLGRVSAAHAKWEPAGALSAAREEEEEQRCNATYSGK